MSKAQKVSTCLWFDTQAEEAAAFYTSLLPNSKITAISRYGAGAPMPEGMPLVVNFELDGREFMALNGGPHFKFTEASSMVVKCDTQAEIDALWSKLTADGGEESQCGWLKDKYGLSWQIIPSKIGDWISGKDKAAAARVMDVIMNSVKLDIAQLETAYKGK